MFKIRRSWERELQVLQQAESAVLAAADAMISVLGQSNELWTAGASPTERLIRSCAATDVQVATYHLLVRKCLDSQDYMADRHLAAILKCQGEPDLANSVLAEAWQLARRGGMPENKEILAWFNDLSPLTDWYARHLKGLG